MKPDRNSRGEAGAVPAVGVAGVDITAVFPGLLCRSGSFACVEPSVGLVVAVAPSNAPFFAVARSQWIAA
jgi:hypothetical protein